MPYTEDELNEIYDKTGGYCNYCGKKLSFVNYGRYGRKGAWEIDHSVPRVRGGTSYYRNLVPACIDCNHDKGAVRGSYYKRGWEPATLGGKLVELLGLSEGFLGASRRKRPKW